jgi:iron complex transport system ATP-binding protein
MLRARGLVVRAGTRELLRDVSLDVRPGTLTALLGPNGAGKSTLLSVLGGQRAPEEGSLDLFDRPLSDWSGPARARRLAVLQQEHGGCFGLNALELALLGRTPHRRGRDSLRDLHLARLALRRTGALHLQDRDVDTLSVGERQRVHLARALAQVWEPVDGPCLLLLDEPTAALDACQRHAVLRLLAELAREGLGVLVVLHELELAARWADRVLVLDDGRTAAEGPPDEALDDAVLARVFGLRAHRLSFAMPLVCEPLDDEPAAPLPDVLEAPLPWTP